MILSSTQFKTLAVPIRDGAAWSVALDPANNRGVIRGCSGETDEDAVEDAWNYYCEMVAALGRVG